MSENLLISPRKKPLLIIGIASSFFLLLLVISFAAWVSPDKRPNSVLLFKYKSTIPETVVKVYFDVRAGLEFDYQSTIPETMVTVYYDVGAGLNEEHAYSKVVRSTGDWKEVRLELPNTMIYGLRLDPATGPGDIGIRNLRIVDGVGAVRLTVPPSSIESGNQIFSRQEKNKTLTVKTTPNADDPNLLIAFDEAIDLRPSEPYEKWADVRQMATRVFYMWWVIPITGWFIFDLYYQPLFLRKKTFLYLLLSKSFRLMFLFIPALFGYLAIFLMVWFIFTN